GVGGVAVADDAFQGIAGYRQHEGGRAGGDQQPVIVRFAAVLGDHTASASIDSHNLSIEQQADAVLAIPGEVVQHDIFEALFASKNGRKQDAVVIRVRLGTEHRDVVELGGDLAQFLERANA